MVFVQRITRAIILFTGAALCFMRPQNASADIITPIVSFQIGNQAAPGTSVGATQIVAATSASPLVAVINDPVGSGTYAGFGDSKVCDSMPCSISLPLKPDLLFHDEITRASVGGPPVVISSFYVFSPGGMLPTQVNPNTLGIVLPKGYGRLDVGMSANNVGIPVLHLTSEPSVPANPIEVDGDISLNGSSDTAVGTLSGQLITDAGQLPVKFSVSSSTISGALDSNSPIPLNIGSLQTQVSALSLNVTPVSADVSLDLSVLAGALGRFETHALVLNFANSRLTIDPTNAVWSAPSGQISFGPQLQLSYDRMKLAFDSVLKAPKFTLAGLTVTSPGCKPGKLGDLSFENDSLVGDSGPGSTLRLSSPIALPLGTTCVTTSNLGIGISIANKSLDATFDATVADPWVGTGGSFSAKGLHINWSAANGLSVTPGGSFSLSGQLAILGFHATNLVGKLGPTGSISLQGSLDGVAFTASDLKADGFDATFSGGSFAPLGFKFTDAGGGFSIRNDVRSSSFYLDSGTMSLPLSDEKGNPIILKIIPPAANSSAHAFEVSSDGINLVPKHWPSVALVGSSPTSFVVGPMNFAVREHSSGNRPLTADFAACEKNKAIFEGDKARLLVCGQLVISNRAGAKAISDDFCTWVGATYSATDSSFEFSTIEQPPPDPNAPLPKTGCNGNFEFAKVFSAQIQTFTITNDKSSTGSQTTVNAQVLVKPSGPLPGINSKLFDSALFDFSFSNEIVGLSGTIYSTQEFAVPNFANFKITQLDVKAAEDLSSHAIDITLNAGDSSAAFPGLLGITVYGKGGGLEYHRGQNDSAGKWKPRFPGVRIPETIISFIGQLITSGAAYSLLTHGLKIK